MLSLLCCVVVVGVVVIDVSVVGIGVRHAVVIFARSVVGVVGVVTIIVVDVFVVGVVVAVTAVFVVVCRHVVDVVVSCCVGC